MSIYAPACLWLLQVCILKRYLTMVLKVQTLKCDRPSPQTNSLAAERSLSSKRDRHPCPGFKSFLGWLTVCFNGLALLVRNSSAGGLLEEVQDPKLLAFDALVFMTLQELQEQAC